MVGEVGMCILEEIKHSSMQRSCLRRASERVSMSWHHEHVVAIGMFQIFDLKIIII